MSNIVQATSQNSQIQLKEQSSLSDYIQSYEEKEIVQAVEGSKQIAKVESREELINAVVKWRMYIGMPKSDIAEELVLVAGFIYENYGFLTISEIELAMKLSVLRKLKEVEFHGYFSPMYVARVLDSYLYYRKMTMADAIRRKEKAILDEREKLNRPSPEKQAEDTKILLKNFYEEFKQNNEIRDVFNICYNYLRRTKLMLVSKDTVEEAQKYGNKKVQDKIQETKRNFKKVEFNLEIEEKKWARNYCVGKFFETVDINVLLNNIKPEHFS